LCTKFGLKSNNNNSKDTRQPQKKICFDKILLFTVCIWSGRIIFEFLCCFFLLLSSYCTIVYSPTTSKFLVCTILLRITCSRLAAMIYCLYIPIYFSQAWKSRKLCFFSIERKQKCICENIKRLKIFNRILNNE
jgi:hypothetical protein